MADCDPSSWFKSMTLFFGGTAQALGADHSAGSPHKGPSCQEHMSESLFYHSYDIHHKKLIL